MEWALQLVENPLDVNLCTAHVRSMLETARELLSNAEGMKAIRQILMASVLAGQMEVFTCATRIFQSTAAAFDMLAEQAGILMDLLQQYSLRNVHPCCMSDDVNSAIVSRNIATGS